MSIRNVFVTMTRRLAARRGVRLSAKHRRAQALLQLQVETLESRTLLSVLTVSTTADSGPGSLRQAILDANSNPGLDTIAFNIGSGFQSIQPTSALPAITDPVFIDGTTQPGFAGTPLIELNGTNAGLGVTGLTITAGNSTVRGLSVNHFQKSSTSATGGDGIDLLTNGGNVIEGNYIGTDSTGAAAAANGRDGIHIGQGSQGNLIGSNADGVNDAAERNVISGNFGNGIIIQDSGTTGNVVAGNYIGINAAGTAALGNHNGIMISSPANNNTIGGTSPAARNVISGNSSNDGLDILSSGNIIQGNYIGTNAAGTAALMNFYGILLGAPNNTVGGTTAAARNLISGNFYGILMAGSSSAGDVIQGNFIGTDVSGTVSVANTYGVYISSTANATIGGTTAAARNLISGNSDGVHVFGSTSAGAVIEGNYIGTDVTGTASVANGNGVYIDGVANTTVGGTTAGAGNLISGNNGANAVGVYITNTGANGNLVVGNLIGTDASGNSKLGNTYGIGITLTFGNTVGGTTANARNIISANSNGIYITQTGTGANLIQGNYIGTNAAGTAAVGNGTGISLNSSATTVGGTVAGAGNLISGNTNGVAWGSSVTSTLVQGNWIGTDATGTTALGNTYGMNAGGSNNIIGGTSAGARNVISGNSNTGIYLSGSNNVVQGNYIGTNAAGTAKLPNNQGVQILSPSTNNTVGGTAAGAGNVISGNSSTGLLLGNSGNLVQGNYIGTDATGTVAVGNQYGVSISSAAGVVLGGTTAAARNIISGNNYGISVTGTKSAGTMIEGNFIGTDVTGTVAVPNTYGVYIAGAANITVGGTPAGAGNLISGDNATNSAGVYILGTAATGNLVEGNLVGTDVTGTKALGNYIGVEISSAANTIGGTIAAARNVISGNQTGVLITGTGAANSVVEGNYIGTNAAGTAAVANSYGIRLGAANNTVGGTTAGAGNLISGNQYGLFLAGVTSAGDVIQGNFIGTDVGGTISLANSYGVYVSSTANATIGGTTAAARNLISGNSSGVYVVGSQSAGTVIEGNYIGTDVTGTISVMDASGIIISGAANVTVGGTVAGAGNLISGNAQAGGGQGVYIANGATGNVILGNLIGTDVTGNNRLGNFIGIEIDTASNNTIGGTTAGARNIISGNVNVGVYVFAGTSTGNVVEGNYIGTNATGTTALGNNKGVAFSTIEAPSSNTIGGTAAGAGNLISGNNSGIYLFDNTANTVVQGNWIGTDASGMVALANSYGIIVYGSHNTIGGTVAGARNVISGNTTTGLYLSAMNDVVQGNYIGTNPAGMAKLANGDGIETSTAAYYTTIGGTVAGAGNLISGNTGIGIQIEAGPSLIQGNLIGTDPTGTAALPNQTGIDIRSGISVTVGGTAAGAANIIAFNTGKGVTVEQGNSNPIRANAIFANGGIGIDLGDDGVTLNDAHGHVTNNLNQNFPVLTAFQPGATIQISGTLSSTANTSFAIDFYANPAPDPSGYGQGQFYLGSATVQTDANGNATFTVTLAAATSASEIISATATDLQLLNTSEFSADRSAVSPTAIALTAASGNYGGTTTLVATLTSGGSPVSSRTVAFKLNGVSVGNAVTDTNGHATLNNVNLGSLGAGSYTMAVAASFSGDSGYSASSGIGSLTVNPAPLTITATAASKVYGQANPIFTVSYVGFVNGDSVANLSGSLSFTTAATTASHVGSYAVTPSGLTATNYTITFVSGTLSVTPAPLTISADNQTKVYGQANPTLTASYSGFVNGDAPASLTTPVSLTTSATAASTVGSYAITASGATATDYAITFVNGTLTITPAALSVTANNATKVYGQANPAFSVSYGGFVNGDTAANLSGSLSFTAAATTASHVGSYAITPSGLTATNYTITFVSGTLSVTPAPLTISADNQTKVYGQANPTLTASYTGFVNGDTAASLTTPVSLTTSATAASSVGSYAITASGATSADYAITFVNGMLTITPAPLTITANNATKVYGQANPAFAVGYSGFVNGDSAASLGGSLSFTTIATAASHVGSYAVTPAGLTATNYTITFQSGTLTITPAALTITATNQTKVYGAALPTLTASYSGFVNGDTPASLTTPVSLTTSATTASSVGSYAITASGATATDYTITFLNGTLTITPAALSVTANNATKVYGQANPAFSVSYSGFVNGDTATSLGGSLAFTTSATAASHVGSYTVTPSGLTATNYTIAFQSGTLSITPAALTITATNQTKVYGAALPALTASYSGFANGDTAASLTTPVSLTTSATAASHVAGSPYAITAAGAVDPDYTIGYVAGSLTVTPAPLTITANNQVKEFGAALPPLTASYSGFVNGDTPASLSPGVSLATTATAASPVGTYPITASGAGSTDYTITYQSGTLTIFPAASHFLVAGFPSPSTAGTPGTLTVTARTASNTTDTGYLGTIHFTSTDPQAVLPADYAFTAADRGVHTFSIILKTAGTRSVTVTDTALSGITGTQTGITVHAAAATTLTASGFPSPITAGKAGTLKVTLHDPYGNVATGYRGTVHFSSSDPQAVLPLNYTFTAGDAGMHTFTIHLKTAGSQSITVVDTVTATLHATQAGIVVNPAAARKLKVSGFPSPITAGTSAAFTVTVQDLYGNTVPSYTGTVHFRSSDRQALLPANYAFTAADHGVHTFGATLKTPGTQSITATSTTAPRVTGTQAGIMVAAAPSTGGGRQVIQAQGGPATDAVFAALSAVADDSFWMHEQRERDLAELLAFRE